MENVWKVLIVTILAALGAYLRQLAAPLAVLIAVMVLDWISGISSAWKRKQLDSRIGLVGIVKKVCYLLIVAVGMVLDYLIHMLGGEFGLDLAGTYFVGLIVIIWLIINECISILENTSEMGLPVPPFVGALLDRLKRKTEEIAGEDLPSVAAATVPPEGAPEENGLPHQSADWFAMTEGKDEERDE